MNKHTCKLKDTIEYKMYSLGLKSVAIITAIFYIVVISVLISFLCTMPLKYGLIFLLTTIIICSPFFVIFTYYTIKFYKKIKFLKTNFDDYNEMEIILSSPVHIGLNKVKYLIKIDNGNGLITEIESNMYSSGTITGKRMLIGYSSTHNDVIFLKNL